MGAIFLSCARARDDTWHWMAVIQGIFATAHDFVGSLALLLLAAQVYLTARGDDEETVGHFVRPNISYFLRLDFYLPT